MREYYMNTDRSVLLVSLKRRWQDRKTSTSASLNHVDLPDEPRKTDQYRCRKKASSLSPDGRYLIFSNGYPGYESRTSISKRLDDTWKTGQCPKISGQLRSTASGLTPTSPLMTAASMPISPLPKMATLTPDIYRIQLNLLKKKKEEIC